MTKNNYRRVYEGQQSGKTDASIVSLLKTGKENAISTKELLRLSECGSIRELQKRIAEERSSGAIIYSGSGAGYWLPKNRKEIEDSVRLWGRGRRIFLTLPEVRKIF